MKKPNLVLVRYGEIALKSEPVRRKLENLLADNMRASLKKSKTKYKVRKEWGRIFVEVKDTYKVLKALPKVFGIVSFSPCWKTSADLEDISKIAVPLAKSVIKKGETFAVSARRVGEHKFSSKEIEENIGAKVVRATKAKVRLKNPDRTVFVEVRDSDAYIYSDVVKGPGGMPLGSQGRVLCLIKNKCDAEACRLVMKRGSFPVAVFSGAGKDKIREYLKVLEAWTAGRKIRYYNVKRDSHFIKNIEDVLKQEHCLAVVCGEELGNADFALDKKIGVPVFRPLVGTGKQSSI